MSRRTPGRSVTAVRFGGNTVIVKRRLANALGSVAPAILPQQVRCLVFKDLRVLESEGMSVGV